MGLDEVDRSFSGVDPSAPSEEGAPEELLERVFGRELLRRARLTEPERACLVAIAAGFSLAEWAEKRGLSAETARVHKFNAKKKLRRAQKIT